MYEDFDRTWLCISSIKDDRFHSIEQLHGLIVMLCSHCMLLYLLISLYHAAFYGLHQYTGCNKKQHGEKGNSKTSFQENVWLPPKFYFPYWARFMISYFITLKILLPLLNSHSLPVVWISNIYSTVTVLPFW